MIPVHAPLGVENLLHVNLLQPSFLQEFAARILNSLPEGILIAGLVWLMLRLLPRQNSGTRFAMWFLALVAVAALPFSNGFGMAHVARVFGGAAQPFLTISTTWAFVLLFAWALIAIAGMLRLAFGIVRIHRLLRTCTPIDSSQLDPAIGRVIAKFSAAHSAPLATSEKMNVPAVVGLITPTIVIPRWALQDLAPDELNAVLLHEYAHVARHDGWSNLLQKLMRALFCFHPAMWWIDRRLSLEREMACDDYVLAETHNPRAYAECLLVLLERNFARRGWALAQAAVHHAREATLRMSQILDANRPSGARVWKPAIAIAGALAFVCVTVLPETRQIVQVAPGDARILSTASNMGPDSLALSPAAAVVPTALHASTSMAAVVPAAFHEATAHDQQPRAHRTSAKLNTSRKARAQWLATRQNPDSAIPHEQTEAQVIPVVEVPTIVPVSETILVISTGQAAGNSLQWSICVWRFMFVSRHIASVAVASHKT